MVSLPLARRFPPDVSQCPTCQEVKRLTHFAAFQLVTGRVWRGCAFGGVKGRSQMNSLVADYKNGSLKVDEFITHRKVLGEINNAFETMKQGDCIRAVVDMNKLDPKI